MSKIKVIHVLHSVGGVDIYLRQVTENVNPEKIETIIIHHKDNDKKPYLNSKGETIKQYFIPIQREINLFKDFIAVYKTYKIFLKEKPSIVHAHSAKGGIIARVASLFYRVIVLHTPHAYSYLSSRSKLKRGLFMLIERIFKNFNSYLLATSDSERNRGINEVGYQRSKALSWDNSILPLNDFSGTSHISLPKKYICTVGRPSYQKNIEMMMRLIAELKKEIPHIFLVVMGVGEYSPNKDNIVKIIEKLNLKSNVLLINWIEREKILAIIKESVLYVSTSRYEGLPYSIIESIALSKSCVITDCDGNRDLVKDGFNGYLVEQENVLLMREKVKQLYHDSDLREKFERNSLSYFEENHNLLKNIYKLENIYRDYAN